MLQNKMFTKKGYSLITWSITFTVLLAAFALFTVPLRRAIRAKLGQTSDYLLWTSWGSTVKTQPPDKNTRAKSGAVQRQKVVTNEDRAGTFKVYLDPAQNTSAQTAVSSSVEKGSEALLHSDNTNSLFNEVDLN